MYHPNQPLFGEDTVTITETTPHKDLEYLFEKLRNRNHKRSHNYVLDDRTTSQALAYSITYLNGEPALGSIAWSRPMYNGAVRLMTKYCVDPDLENTNFGRGTENVMRLDVIDHINQQIEICSGQGYDTFFISQEGRLNGKRIRKYVETINKYTDHTWQVSDEPVLVAPNPPDPSCWQYVISNREINFNYETK